MRFCKIVNRTLFRSPRVSIETSRRHLLRVTRFVPFFFFFVASLLRSPAIPRRKIRSFALRNRWIADARHVGQKSVHARKVDWPVIRISTKRRRGRGGRGEGNLAWLYFWFSSYCKFVFRVRFFFFFFIMPFKNLADRGTIQIQLVNEITNDRIIEIEESLEIEGNKWNRFLLLDRKLANNFLSQREKKCWSRPRETFSKWFRRIRYLFLFLFHGLNKQTVFVGPMAFYFITDKNITFNRYVLFKEEKGSSKRFKCFEIEKSQPTIITFVLRENVSLLLGRNGKVGKSNI